MRVEVVLPGSLADLAGGTRHVTVDPGGGADGTTLRAVLDALAARHPVLGRRIRDEAGALRRFVNVYVDGEDVRWQGGLATAVGDGAVVQVLPSVAGGC
ncbi:ubiquitin-like small modifier protein 1 [Blastococcus sp. SYSU DS0552]